MPQSKPKGKPDLTAEQWAQYDTLKADPQNCSFRAIVKMMGIPYSRVWRAVQARLPVPANGTDSSVPSAPSTPTALERTIVIGEPVSTPPEYPSTPAHDVLIQRVDNHDQRLDVLEAFMRKIAQHPAYRKNSAPGTPQYTTPREWKKSGAEFTVDMPDKLRAYAKAHGPQVREVIDQALHEFLAARETPLPVPYGGDEGARHE